MFVVAAAVDFYFPSPFLFSNPVHSCIVWVSQTPVPKILRDKVKQAAELWNCEYHIFDGKGGILSESYLNSYNFTKELRKKENDKADISNDKEERNNDKKKELDDSECEGSDDECKSFIRSVIAPARSSGSVRREDDYIYGQNDTRKTNKQTNKRPLLGTKSKWAQFLSLSDNQLTKHGSFIAANGLEPSGQKRRRRTDEKETTDLSGGYVTTRSQKKKEQREPQTEVDLSIEQQRQQRLKERGEKKEESRRRRKKRESAEEVKDADDITSTKEGETYKNPHSLHGKETPAEKAREHVQKASEQEKEYKTICFPINSILIFDDILISSDLSSHDNENDPRQQKREMTNILRHLSQVAGAGSNHLKLNTLMVFHSYNFSGGSVNNAETALYSRIIKNNLKSFTLFPINSREIRNILQSNSSGQDYIAIKELTNVAFNQSAYYDTLNKQSENPPKNCLTFAFPENCVNDKTVNFRINDLSLDEGTKAALFLPPAFLTHDLLTRSDKLSSTTTTTTPLPDEEDVKSRIFS